jgi:Xaa-Pro aminopeptidase
VRYTARLTEDVARAASDLGLKRVAMAGREFLPAGAEVALRERLAERNLGTLDDGATAFRGLRTIKSPADQAGMLLAARLADDAFGYILPMVRPGVTENDLVAEIQYFLRKAGAEDSLILISSSALRAHPIPGHRRLAPGDVLQLSIEPIAPGGYWCQTIRVLSLGQPSTELLGAYGACRDAQQAMEPMLRPGVVASEVCARGRRALGHLAATDDTPLGHGMGLDLGEPPRIEPGDATALQAGMFITLHPSVHPGRVGVFVGDTYHVSGEGTRRLSALPQEIMVVQ